MCFCSLHIVYPLKTKHRLLYLKTQFIPHRKHFISVIKTNQFMICVAKVAVCSEINAKHINSLCGQNIQFYQYQQALRG
jgi:hypothetical protein